MENKRSTDEIWQGLMAAKEIEKVVKISHAHWYNLVKQGKAPAPVIRIPPRYTRWRASDVQAWVQSPSTWIASNLLEAGV